MQGMIYEIVHKYQPQYVIENGKRRVVKPSQGSNPPIGVIVAKKFSDNSVFIGWSKFNKKDGKFNPSRGLQIAAGRATPRGFVTPYPEQMEDSIIEMYNRAKRYFKTDAVCFGRSIRALNNPS
jgi:hypothetical protein